MKLIAQSAPIDTKTDLISPLLVADVPNAFVQMTIEPKEKVKKVIMQIKARHAN
jgi:hypothetical protein